MWDRDARADDGIEPSYGRIAGDATLVVGAGVTVASSGPRAAGELRLRYLDTAGLFVAYEDGVLLGGGTRPARLFAAGFELRPLFLFRWLRGHETHCPRLDLMLDSLGLELGATLPQDPGGSFASAPGLQAGLGIEVPIGETADGPWIGLHGGVRMGDDVLASGSSAQSEEDRELYLSITLAWHEVILLHAVDVGDLPPQ
ncbi:MAG: hypothetical protein ACREJ3_03280 [Polyangiaceae bacterium]